MTVIFCIEADKYPKYLLTVAGFEPKHEMMISGVGRGCGVWHPSYKAGAGSLEVNSRGPWRYRVKFFGHADYNPSLGIVW